MDYILQTRGLSKRYKKHMAVDHVDMHIRRGDIYGFVGENGSGKTTIIRLITGLISPTTGNYDLFGIPSDFSEIRLMRRKVGAVVETPSIYTNLSAYRNLKLQCGILGIDDDEKIKQVLWEVGLSDLYADRKRAGDFSLGMRQRLGIAMALLGDPEFLILDEPMNGLDPAGIVEIRELILKLNREKGITFLISSHILTELSLVATNYGIISKGKILKEITAEELQRECAVTTVIRCDDPAALSKLLESLLPTHRLFPVPDGVKITEEIDLNQILGAILAAGLRILSVNCSQTSFEDYYLNLIGGVRHV